MCLLSDRFEPPTSAQCASFCKNNPTTGNQGPKTRAKTNMLITVRHFFLTRCILLHINSIPLLINVTQPLETKQTPVFSVCECVRQRCFNPGLLQRCLPVLQGSGDSPASGNHQGKQKSSGGAQTSLCLLCIPPGHHSQSHTKLSWKPVCSALPHVQ